jgi:hypothetical protein
VLICFTEADLDNRESSRWSAQRLLPKHFDIREQHKNSADVLPLFTGEMIYPFMFDDYAELAPTKGVAEILANKSDWPKLYDEAQLAENEVPIYAAVYVDDMYVNFEVVQETVKKVKGVKQYITNMYYHDALRSKTDEVMKNLFALRDDVID